MLICSCGNEESAVTTIKVDLNNVEKVDLMLQHTAVVPIQLENVGLIHQLAVKDSIALLKTDKVLSINLNTGKQIAEYSRKGRANNEYLSACILDLRMIWFIYTI